ncbi:hypothetical protein [Brevundimonas sp.]|uniref:hypothetical protein n=1 Tax=Brevundimonas sp. TaxID=1871086 RepID=UPI0025C48A1B|nr:hypothetical protein [Brevundimonas sp.]
MSNHETANLTGVIQTGAAVLAVFAGFAYVGFQRWAETAAAGRAAGHLARHSIDFVTARLDALVDPTESMELALRGSRAMEMVEVFRELEISLLPPRFIESVAIIRSAVFAINRRIDEVLKDDATRQSQRRVRLHSAGRTLDEARTELEGLRKRYACWNQHKFKAKKVTERMEAFLAEAIAAKKKTTAAEPAKIATRPQAARSSRQKRSRKLP